MKIVVTVLVLVATTELVLGVPGYGPPQPLPVSSKFNKPHPNGGAPIPAKYPPPHFGGNFGKNEFYSKFNPHSLPPGVRGPLPPQLPPHFGKYPPPPPPGKYQPHQHQQHQQHHQQQQQQHQPHHPINFRPLGPQFQSKPHLLPNGVPPQGQIGGGGQERLQQAQSRPVPKITNVYGTAPKLPGPPDFPPRFPAPVAPVQPPVPFQETPKGPYIINSDDERGPIKTIPAPNLNPADKPANFEEQLYRAQHQQSYVQPLDNSIIDERPSYQVTEDPSKYKPFSGQPSYFAPDPGTVPTPKVPPTTDINSLPTVGKVPLDIALQQHLDKQHQQLLSAAEQSAGSSDTLTPNELYSLLNGNPTAVVSPQTAFMVPQPVVYAVPQPLDVQAGSQAQYQSQSVPLQYGQQPAATAVHLQYAQPAATELQYLQPQTVQYQPQPVQYQPQAVQYQPQAVHYQHYQQRPAEQYSVQPTAEGPAAYEHQAHHQQEQEQQQQQQHQEHEQQQQQEQEQQHEQQQDHQQPQNNDVQYQQDDYQPRNRDKEAAAVGQQEQQAEQDQSKFESIRNQYYSAVPNEQTAGVLAQIAESAANNDAAADEPSHADTAKAAEGAAADQTAQLKTSVQIQQSVPLYEGTYASSRRTNQEYADEGGDGELMEGSESVVSVSGSPSPSVNGHAPSQFPYNAAKINAFSAN